MNVREFREEDLPMLNEWWRGHDWPGIPLSSLSTRGFIVDECVAGFLYVTDSDIGFMEWIISDPKANARQKSEALNVLIKEVCSLAKSLGCRILFSFFKHKGLMNRVEQFGFQKTDSEMTHFIKEL